MRLVLPSSRLHRFVAASAAASLARLGGSGADVAEAVASTMDAIRGRGAAVGGPDHPSLRVSLLVAAAAAEVCAVDCPSHADCTSVRRVGSEGGAPGVVHVRVDVPRSQVGRARWIF